MTMKLKDKIYDMCLSAYVEEQNLNSVLMNSYAGELNGSPITEDGKEYIKGVYKDVILQLLFERKLTYKNALDLYVNFDLTRMDLDKDLNNFLEVDYTVDDDNYLQTFPPIEEDDEEDFSDDDDF